MEKHQISDQYRPAVFWSFNDHLEKEKLKNQLSSLREAGLMGGFMHSRVGLVTEYMSEEWLDQLSFCCKTAKEWQTHLWLYDEDRWPSGYGGGAVLRENPDLKGKALCLIPEGRAGELAVRKPIKQVSHEGKRYTIAVCELKTGNPWYGGGCYVDLLNPDATDTFLKTTHEKYKKRLGQYFGKELKGVFSDEFCYSQKAAYPVFNLPFTDGLEEKFLESKGYSLTDVIENLFFDLDGYETLRFDFYDLLTRLFIESYTKRYQNWCHANSLLLTGHLMNEDTLTGQTEWVGAVMPHYAAMDMPGIDKLGLAKDQAVTVKQVSSAAEQLGRRCLCEAFGCIGHQSGPKAIKGLSDWLNALGISFINPHLSLYSMRGERKRDYPPNISPLQPWFENAKGLFDHIARVSEFVSMGTSQTDLLVLHPISSVWSEFSPLHKPNPTFSIWSPKNQYARENYLPEREQFEKPFFDLTEQLLGEGIDFHYGDEILLEQYGALKESGAYIGRCAYQTVLVPPSRVIRSTTLRWLADLARMRGKEAVIFIERFPDFVDNQRSQLDFGTMFTLTPDNKMAVRLAKKQLRRGVEALDRYTGKPAEKLLCNYRASDGREIAFLCNASEKAQEVLLKLPFAEPPVALDTVTGAYYQLPVEGEPGRYVLRAFFQESGSLLLLTGVKAEKSADVLSCGVSFGKRYRVLERKIPQHSCSSPNLLPLDVVNFTAQGVSYPQTPLEGLWHTVFYKLPNGTPFEAEYAFEIDKMPSCPVWAMIEMARNLDGIWVNGHEAKILKEEAAEGCFDFSFDKVSLPNLHEGRNTIRISGKKMNNIVGVGNHESVPSGCSHNPTELEAIYICGDFQAVSSGRGGYTILGDLVVRAGDTVRNGMPFYAGKLCAQLTVETGYADRLIVDADAASVRVTVNGTVALDAYLAPFVFDLSGLLTEPENNITIEAFQTLANAFGPLHLAEREKRTMIGPMLIADMTQYSESPYLFPFGIHSVSFCQKELASL